MINTIKFHFLMSIVMVTGLVAVIGGGLGLVVAILASDIVNWLKVVLILIEAIIILAGASYFSDELLPKMEESFRKLCGIQ